MISLPWIYRLYTLKYSQEEPETPAAAIPEVPATSEPEPTVSETPSTKTDAGTDSAATPSKLNSLILFLYYLR